MKPFLTGQRKVFRTACITWLIDILCFVQFLTLYYVKPKSASEKRRWLLASYFRYWSYSNKSWRINHYPKAITLISSKDKLKCRKIKTPLRYQQPRAKISMEQYAHHLLFAFYNFHNEEHLKSPRIRCDGNNWLE